MRMSALLPVTASPPGGPAQRAGGELGGEMALVVGRPALVGDRVAMLGGDPAGFDKGFLGGRLAAQVRLGLGRGELLPADRAAVPDDRVGDHPLGVTQDRKVLAHQRRGEQLRVADERAEAQLIAVDANERQLAQVVDVDQDLGLCQAQLHHRDQAVPARDDPGLGSELGKQGEGVFDAGRPLVRELRWDLHPCSRGSRQLPKQPVYYGTSYRTARRSGKHRRHYRRHYGGNVPVSVDELPGRFRAALPPAVDARRADEVRADLLARWSEPHRHYHTLDHLAAVLSIVDITGPVALAAWFHDAVYDPRRDDNEEASARLAEAALNALELPADVIAEVARLVRLTATHDPEPGDRNGALLTDADLAILAAEPAAYDRYAAAVRREYSHVPDREFREGRAAVLRRLNDAPALYRIVPEKAEWEARARANLTRELAAL